MKLTIQLAVAATILFLFGPIVSSALSVVGALVLRVAELVAAVPQIL